MLMWCTIIIYVPYVKAIKMAEKKQIRPNTGTYYTTTFYASLLAHGWYVVYPITKRRKQTHDESVALKACKPYRSSLAQIGAIVSGRWTAVAFQHEIKKSSSIGSSPGSWRELITIESRKYGAAFWGDDGGWQKSRR